MYRCANDRSIKAQEYNIDNITVKIYITDNKLQYVMYNYNNNNI